ncbi:TetR family transcriptional regulator [Solwaraspora sp. WMMD406]|uniref:TetR/AcrR family transcriptional regulator n=1 Tax=Solwaraspora sp. WMMD406 TaxID=3016095 RepID=UPI002415D921|nr:TetR family transcriptional regulator [Solwaraspora sp. WMMD406]MDG4765406.1 TetR family transcriptional regulator [Solwaraspora sp. WMMD406]
MTADPDRSAHTSAPASAPAGPHPGPAPHADQRGAARRPVRPRDPEGRRQALAAATLEVVAEVGIGRTTHRAVAARAGVPLGATTYYFPTLTDLIVAGLRQAQSDVDAELDRWAGRLGDGTDLPALPARLARLIGEYLADRGRALTELELYLAAARSPELRPLARAWRDRLCRILSPVTGDRAAYAVAVFVDGVLLQHFAIGEPVDAAAVESAIAALLRTESPAGRPG